MSIKYAPPDSHSEQMIRSIQQRLNEAVSGGNWEAAEVMVRDLEDALSLHLRIREHQVAYNHHNHRPFPMQGAEGG